MFIVRSVIVTDWQTDRRHHRANSQSCYVHYDRTNAYRQRSMTQLSSFNNEFFVRRQNATKFCVNRVLKFKKIRHYKHGSCNENNTLVQRTVSKMASKVWLDITRCLCPNPWTCALLYKSCHCILSALDQELISYRYSLVVLIEATFVKKKS